MPAPRARIPAPKAPRLPPPPKVGRLKLAPIRSSKSVQLDQAVTAKSKDTLPPFVRWDRFLDTWVWKQGEHITTIGPTGSGKTVLNRYLLRRRSFVAVLGIKNRDPELYGAYEREGYQLEHRFHPVPPADADDDRILFVPTSNERGAAARKDKAKAFRNVLNDVYDVGSWTVYADDIQYMADKLRLADDFEELWLNGRSEEVSVVASSQEPVDIPVMAYSAATHLFLFKNPDLYRARRMGELAGLNREIVTETVLQMPKHEFLYLNKDTGQMVRSMVIR